MEIVILISIVALLALGVLGSILPVLPGPLLSYIALLLYHFFIEKININALVWIGVVVIFVFFLDYFLQIYGVKKSGGKKYAVRGSVVGMLLGFFFFPPFGIFAGAFIGAFIGAKIEKEKHALNIAFGAFLGFFVGTILKLCLSFYIIYFILF